MFAPAAVLPALGLLAFVTALPNPTPEDVSPDRGSSNDISPAAALVCEAPTGDCSLVGTCEYCCIGEPGSDNCHTHGITPCGEGDEGIIYHCDDEH